MLQRIKLPIFYGILIGAIFFSFEVCSYYILNNYFVGRGLVYNPAKITQRSFDEYLAQRHPLLGWLQGKSQRHERDTIGSRLIPAFPDPEINKSCVSIYGDSYTWSNRTTPAEAWSNQLSILLGCRVSNFGITGYGTDQAYLRFLSNTNDTSKIVILNHFVFDILRNVNQYWGVRISNQVTKFQFKPRFILDENNSLKLVKIPDLNLIQFEELQSNPELYLKHDYFLPNSHYGSQFMKFPYTFVLLKTVLTHAKFKSLLKGEPAHAPYYKAEHPSGSLQITAEILEAFHSEALKTDRVPIITVIPYMNDIDYFLENGKWCYQNLLDIMQNKNIEVLNVGEEILEILKNGDNNRLYAGEGHFNAEGDKMLATIIFNHLKENNLTNLN